MSKASISADRLLAKTKQAHTPKEKKATPKSTAKQVAIQALLAEGIDARTIADHLQVSHQYVYRISGKCGKNTTFEHLKPIAMQSLEKLMKGEKVGKIKAVKCSTVLAASKEVLDRTDPKVNLSVTETHSFSRIPAALKGPKVIDVTPSSPAESKD